IPVSCNCDERDVAGHPWLFVYWLRARGNSLMAIPTEVQNALNRLVLYNSGSYSPGSNPYGFEDYGNVVNFPLALQDTALVANWFGITGGLPGPKGDTGDYGADGNNVEFQ